MAPSPRLEDTFGMSYSQKIQGSTDGIEGGQYTIHRGCETGATVKRLCIRKRFYLRAGRVTNLAGLSK